MPHSRMQEYVNVDYSRALSMVALAGESDNELIIAEARFERDEETGFGDVAFAVDERCHGLGIGTFLYEMLVRLAKKRGLTGNDPTEFEIAGDTGEESLSPGETRTVSVAFDPSSVGDKSAALRILSDDQDKATVDVAIAGTGIAAALAVDIVEDSIPENGGSSTATVRRNTGTDGDLEVNLASDDLSEATVPSTVTIARNTDTTDALIVELSSSAASEATVPETAEIPAGQATVEVDLDAIDDDFVDGDKTVTITATTDSFADGTDTVEVADDDGNSWGAMDSGVSEDLSGVWGTSEDDVFAVGDNGTILNYDGDTWSSIDSGVWTFLSGV